MNVADLIIGVLPKEGSEYLPAFPSWDLIDAAVRYPIECITSEEKRFARKLPSGP